MLEADVIGHSMSNEGAMGLLYLDCRAGAAGDMLLGAMLDCMQKLDAKSKASGLFSRWQEQVQAMLQIEAGGRFELRRVQRKNIEALKIDFFVGDVHADHVGKEGHHKHHHHHRHLKEIRHLLVEHGGTTRAKALAVQIFEILALAEAEAHKCSPEEVHFHEVGAFDSILDIFGFAVAFELLGITEVVCSAVSAGSGSVETAHGTLEVPTPAVRSLIRRHELCMSEAVLGGECLTPTGAAILAAIVGTWAESGLPEDGGIQGAGAGTRDPEGIANVVRCVYLKTASELAE